MDTLYKKMILLLHNFLYVVAFRLTMLLVNIKGTIQAKLKATFPKSFVIFLENCLGFNLKTSKFWFNNAVDIIPTN